MRIVKILYSMSSVYEMRGVKRMKDRKVDHRKRVDIIRTKMVKIVKDGAINYSPRKISSPHDCVGLVELCIDDSDREAFIAIALDTKNQPIAVQTISIGTLNSSLVHPREVFKMAILSNAAGIIIAHNHPSGISIPSNEDIIITKRLSEAGNILGIEVLDHLIIGDNEYTSFREEGIDLA